MRYLLSVGWTHARSANSASRQNVAWRRPNGPAWPRRAGDGGVHRPENLIDDLMCVRPVAVGHLVDNGNEEVFAQDSVHGINRRSAAHAVPYDREAVAQFRLRDRSPVDVEPVLQGEPLLHLGLRGQALQLGDDIRVEDDHASGPVECGQFTHGLSLPQVKIHTAERRNPRTDRSSKIVGWLRFANDIAQDLARLIFHRTAMLGCADAKAPLHVIIKVPDGKTIRGQISVLLHSAA